MDLFSLFNLIAAAFSGATMGSYLLVTLLYRALLDHPDNLNDSLYIYRRLYRLNSVLCLAGGIAAALVNHVPAAFLLAILAVSYVFNMAHILKGLSRACDASYQLVNTQQYRRLSQLQNLIHLAQFLGASYVIVLLATTP